MNNWEEKLLKQWNERVKVKDGFTTLDSAHIGSWLIPFIKSLLLDQRMKTLQEVKKALAYDPDPLSEFIHSHKAEITGKTLTIKDIQKDE